MAKVFIDGSAGTTGLRLTERLENHPAVSLLTLPEAQRKDPQARQDIMNQADIVFFCLPDAAAIEAAGLIQNPDTSVIDTSTAHRTADGWVYGFPELTGQRDKIRSSRRIANPGCHASGVIALLYPLVSTGIVQKDITVSCTSLTGYSGGGKKMIAEYEDDNRSALLNAPRLYGLTQSHKHLPEIEKVCGLSSAPVFCPIVAPYYAGMEVIIGLTAGQSSVPLSQLPEIYQSFYAASQLIRFKAEAGENGFMSACAFAGRDDMQITVQGNDARATLIARFDNLGKGASGAAIQNMNLLLGIDETTALQF
ncbi:MAG: N-acetyl-gamma-glutamyl-phosphate reductase [Clostridia bacterium]|nr:N-acetyl-gamma-glutamyl-phosphate reductase [Clostridia bacterium]